VPATPDPTQAAVSADAGPALDAANPEAAPASAEETIEVWRPGRPEHHRGDRPRPRAARRRERPGERGDSATLAAAVKRSPPQAQTEVEKTASAPPGARHRRSEREKPRSPSGQPRGEGRERRERIPDPNSPFAKLAALKAQLEAGTKERP